MTSSDEWASGLPLLTSSQGKQHDTLIAATRTTKDAEHGQKWSPLDSTQGPTGCGRFSSLAVVDRDPDAGQLPSL